MSRAAILSPEQMKKEIAASHERSRRYGISREERSPDQERLSTAALEERCRLNKYFLDVAIAHIVEFYNFLPPNCFIMAVVDRDGYILHLAGSDELQADFASRNCAPGFRWTERDVGTSAISLCLEKRVPIQLNDKDHYCKRAHIYTSSAAPLFNRDDRLLGVLVVSGSAGLVHPHTLIMIAMAARSVEKQMLILSRNQELALNMKFLDSVIEAAGMGIMALDQELNIWRVNQRGKRILGMGDLKGKPVSVLGNMGLDLEDIRKNPRAWVNREWCLSHNRRDVHFLFNAQPVMSQEHELLGAVLAFEEIGAIRKLADDIAGIKAFYTFDHLVGKSPVFLNAVDLARRAAQTDATVLLRGETGTGKELFAQAIHNGGQQRRNPFVPINCGAIPGELLESELFGYVEGAFTGAQKGGRPGKFELAHGGTLLLDEIGDMPHGMQVKLLRVLQTGEVYRIGARKPIVVNTRIVASTHVDLARAVAQGGFRQDLFYRLNVFPIVIPPLRERGEEDITALTKFFLKRLRTPPPRLTAAAMDALLRHPWAGNVRELENVMQRALHLHEGDVLDVQHLGLGTAADKKGPPRPGTIEDAERDMIAAALEQTHSNMAATAKLLGISRATLYRKVKQFDFLSRVRN
jgi:sigma-54 dependent transcriptional regulator, acetoin dehydrogenase operon transcriptional activator AcoR